MKAIERRENILRILAEKQEPVSGINLAKELNVSRQVIVQDIALLRAAGNDILSMNQGYLIQSGNDKNLHFYPKPQPTNYVKKSSKKKTAALDTDAPALAIEPDDDEPDYDFSSYSSTSEYGWN